MVEGLGFGVSGVRFRAWNWVWIVWGSGFGIEGEGLGGLGLRVSGWGFWV